MRYKDYEAAITFDPEAELFHGEVLDINDTITFQGRSVDELRQALADSVEDYLAFCAERGESPDKPFSGQFLVRVGPDLHRSCVRLARESGKSLNRWISDILESEIIFEAGKMVEGSNSLFGSFTPLDFESSKALTEALENLRTAPAAYPMIPAGMQPVGNKTRMSKTVRTTVVNSKRKKAPKVG